MATPNISPQQRAVFDELARPMMQWIRSNMHPHATVLVTSESAELVEAIMVSNIQAPPDTRQLVFDDAPLDRPTDATAGPRQGRQTHERQEAMISPTPGRVVWFYPASNTASNNFAPPDAGQPLAAIVARVWNDRLVNLAVFDANGVPHSRTSVKLLQDGDALEFEGQMHAAWMPYQKGQAAKHDQEKVRVLTDADAAADLAGTPRPAPESSLS